MTELYAAPDDPLVPELQSFIDRHGLARRWRELDRTPQFPAREFREMGRAGWLGLSLSPVLGGRGLPLDRVAVLLFHLARRTGSVFAKLALQPEFSSVLADYGSAEVVRTWLVPLVHGERLVGNQVTEPGAGSDARSLAATATREGDRYLLSGTKTEVAGALDADAAVVYARVPGADGAGGITAFLVPQDLPGIRKLPGEGDLGERWQRRGSVEYDRTPIPAELRLGEEGAGFRYVRRELTRERAFLAAIYLGVARASWEETVDYVGARTAFGRTLSEQEAVAFPLVDDAARLEAAWRLTVGAVGRIAAGADADAVAALAKRTAVEAALTALDHAIQFHGGRGYSAALPHEQRWRDVRSGRIAHGPDEALLWLAARRLWATNAGR